MSNQTEAKSLFERWVHPERTGISGDERKFAAARISRAQAAGTITDDQARQQHTLLGSARTRSQLRTALAGETSLGTTGTGPWHRIAVLLWLGLSGIQFLVWLMICLISGGWTDAWWLWTVVIGGIVVGGLWWQEEQKYQAELGRG